MNRRAFLGAAAAMAAAPARSEEISEAKAIAGDRFTAGEQEFHLADILAPSAYALHADVEPYFNEARAALGELVAGRALDVETAGEKTRWGARVAHARRRGDELTLQERLVQTGAARVAPQTDNLALIDRLMALEAQARAERLGLWRLDAYRIFHTSAAENAVGAYQLVEGEVIRASQAQGRFYLNFGDDYRSDFTAGAASVDYRRWAKTGFDLDALQGARVRVRGFVQAINGPSIDLTHRKQIEILQEPAP